MNPEKVAAIFESKGGRFLTPSLSISEKLEGIRCLVFDWDGVFHPGTKQPGGSSSFSEVDSMGINLLRFALWYKNGVLPTVVIITGEDNPTARYYAEREHFDAVYFKARKKDVAFEDVQKKHGVTAGETLFVFDDVLDLNLAARVALRMAVSHSSAPLLAHYMEDGSLADYMSYSKAGSALREICELCMGLMGFYEEAVSHRIQFSEDYARYWQARNAGTTQVYLSKDEGSTFVAHP